MKKILYSILLTLFVLFPTGVFAEGDITISSSSLTVEQGTSKTFTISAYNTIGDVTIQSKNNNIASVNTNEWSTGMVEEKQTKTVTITVTGKSVGTTEIILNTDGATFDEEEILKTYKVTVNVTPPKSSNANLSSITIDKKALANFNSNTTNYTLNNTDASTITVDAKVADSKAKISGLGTHNLSYGLNTINIVVTAENGSKKTYTIKVTKNDNRSTNTSLSSITINNENIKLDDNKTDYELNVDNKIETLNIKATTKDEKATVKIENPEKIAVGKNTITITVTAENGSKKTYKINIIRAEKEPTITIDKLEDTINNSQSNIITVDIKDNNNIITKEILEALKSSSKKLIVNKYQDDKLLYTWEIDGKDIKESKDINTLIEFYSTSDNKINELTDYSRYIYINNNLDTSIFNNIVLKIYNENEFNNETIYAYEYNNDKLVKSNNELKYNNTYIEVNNLENGVYVLTQKELKETNNKCIHKTIAIIEFIIIALLLTLIILILNLKKKKTRR